MSVCVWVGVCGRGCVGVLLVLTSVPCQVVGGLWAGRQAVSPVGWIVVRLESHVAGYTEYGAIKRYLGGYGAHLHAPALSDTPLSDHRPVALWGWNPPQSAPYCCF